MSWQRFRNLSLSLNQRDFKQVSRRLGVAQWWNACFVWTRGMCISRKFPDHVHVAGVGGHIVNHHLADSLIE